jgi:hypothetical protein
MFRARMLNADYAPGDESLEVELFDERSIPWPDVAFASVRYSLERYYADRAAGLRRLHVTETPRTARRKRPG